MAIKGTQIEMWPCLSVPVAALKGKWIPSWEVLGACSTYVWLPESSLVSSGSEMPVMSSQPEGQFHLTEHENLFLESVRAKKPSVMFSFKQRCLRSGCSSDEGGWAARVLESQG